MPSEVHSETVGIDEFSVALNRMLADVVNGVDESLEPAVRKACQTGRKSCKRNAKELNLKDRVGRTTWNRYVSGFSYTMKRKNKDVVGEIGQKNVPGLAHLIEKGHATVGGGRARAFPHIAPAARDTFKALEEEISEAVDSAL